MTAYGPGTGRSILSDHPDRNAGSLFTLAEIMELFAVADVMTFLMALNRVQCACEVIKLRDGPGGRLDEGRFQLLVQTLEDTFRLCQSIGFDEARKTIAEFLGAIHYSEPLNVSSLESEIRHCYLALIRNTQDFQFVQVQLDRLKYLTAVAPEPFGDKVATAFPSARFDICEAADCLALERSTAAAFHLMRAVEWGMRALCVDLGLLHIVANKKKAILMSLLQKS